MILEVEAGLRERFAGLQVVVEYVDGVRVTKSGAELQEFKESLCREVKRKYSLESLKDVSTFRSYRDFFWKVGIDPTKIRPAAEDIAECFRKAETTGHSRWTGTIRSRSAYI
jgi:DNA/RNA-binding domain of Phe-tRNA-synthetase-like protein